MYIAESKVMHGTVIQYLDLFLSDHPFLLSSLEVETVKHKQSTLRRKAKKKRLPNKNSQFSSIFRKQGTGWPKICILVRSFFLIAW